MLRLRSLCRVLSDRGDLGGVRLGFLLFFLFLARPGCQELESGAFPVIQRMELRDTLFRQYMSDVEENRRRLFGARPGSAATYGQLTIYQYTTKRGDDLFSIAARCNIPYSALSSLNRLESPSSLDEGKTILLPSCPGLFIPSSLLSDLEMLTGASRLAASEESVGIKISVHGKNETFYFFPGADFSQTERAFFLNAGYFRFPLRNYRLTSSFGVRENPVTGNVSMHRGMDLAAPAGTEVHSVADGTVIEIGENATYGIYVIISHKDRWTSLYGHLQKVETTERSLIKSGALIGRVGSTGQSTGPHLHFELRQDGRAVNPSERLRP